MNARIIPMVALLAGCASGGQLPYNPSSMTADQLKAVAADRSAVAGCTVGTGPWGTVRTVVVQIDRGTMPNGTVSVTNECQVSVTASKPASAP